MLLEMVLLDEKETPLHVAIRENMISKFNDILQEGNLYTIHNLKIIPANDAYKPVKGTFKGLFLLTTLVKKINNISISIPLHYFEFGSMETLAQRVDDRAILTDIIGRLHALGNEEEVLVSGKPTKIRRLELLLKENEVVKVTLWTNIASEFEKAINIQEEGSNIVAITSIIVKKFRDEYSINSTSSSRIYINLDNPHFAKFNTGKILEQHQIKELSSPNSANIDLEKRMSKNRRPLQDIMSMKWVAESQDNVFTIHATINDIDDTFGWNYVACERCQKKVTKEGNQYTCKECKQPSKYPTTRFKIQLKVSDDIGVATFTMFDRDAQQILNTTASELLHTQNANMPDIPPILYTLCKRTFIFEIKLIAHNLKEGFQTYTVTRTFIPKNIILDDLLLKEIKQEPTSPQQISSDESDEELIISQSPKLQPSNKSKGASSNEEVNQISQSPITKKANKQTVTSQSPKGQLSRNSKHASSSSKEEQSPFKKNVKKQSVMSKSSRLQASKKSKDASSTLHELYSISETPLRRKANKQTVLTSSDEEPILLQSLKSSTSKKTKVNKSPAKENKPKNLFE